MLRWWWSPPHKAMFWTVTLSLLQGMRQAAVLFGLTLAFSLPLGLLVALGSMSRCRPVRALFDALVWVIRGTPLVLQLIIIFYGPGLWFGHNIWGSNRMLRDVSFDLPEGETLSVIGSSGSGKTTLLRCLNFLERPDAGVISLRNQTLLDGSRPPVRERELREKRLHFGLVFQDFNLFPQYTALENVTLARRLAKLPGESEADIRDRGLALLEQMGLSDRAGHYPHQLSGGQKQRVAIARALCMGPDVLCFDEPTSALDPELTGEVLRVIRQLADRRTTMIVVTHEMAFARDVADRLIFMDGGVIVEQGDPRQVINHPRMERTRQFLSRYAEY